MTDGWPLRFRHFSLAVDRVDDAAIARTRELLGEYFVKSLRACYFEVLLDGTRMADTEGDIPTLSTRWSSKPDEATTIPLRGTDSASTTQTAHVYLHQRPLWITAEDGGLLEAAQRNEVPLIDSWSDVDGLPRYRDHGESLARTSIVVPLEYGNRTFGVLNLEFEDRLTITDNGKETIRILASSLARVIWLNQTYATANSDTLQAFEALEPLPQMKTSPLKRRTVFLSTASHADQAVVEVLRSVLGEFDPLFEVKFWRDESLSGNIKQQVRDALVSAEFGVCYLSQAAGVEGGEYPFEDNVNVIFEAGMLQAVHELRGGGGDNLSRWIPVREMPPHSAPPPFDFATDRIVTVPRSEDTHQLDTNELTERFRAAVTSQVESLGLR